MPSKRLPKMIGINPVHADLLLAPAVIALRLPILASEAMASGPWPKETIRAVSEKTSAMAEGALAAQMTIVRSMWNFWPEAIAGKMPSLLSGEAMHVAAVAAAKPAGQRVGANFKRLSGKKPK